MEAVRPNAPGSLRSGKGRNDTLSKKTMCCIFMHNFKTVHYEFVLPF